MNSSSKSIIFAPPTLDDPRRCAGGCPALGLVFAGEARGLDGEDLSKRLFFDGPWEGEIVAALDGWKNLTLER